MIELHEMPVTSELNLQGYFLTHQDPDQGQEKTLGRNSQACSFEGHKGFAFRNSREGGTFKTKYKGL